MATALMANIVNYRPGSEDLERLTAGWVMANRINDVVAKPTTNRYRAYLKLVQGQLVDPELTDPQDVWRHKDLVPRALQGYEVKNGVSLSQGLLYALPDYRIAAAPHAVEGDLAGITVHCRRTLETYLEAVRIGVTTEMGRHAHAMMWVTGVPYWIHLDYFEDPEQRTRKLYEHLVKTHEQLREAMGDALVSFYQKSVLRAAQGA
jgi:hypothetical protein